MNSIFHEKSYTKCSGETISRPKTNTKHISGSTVHIVHAYYIVFIVY